MKYDKLSALATVLALALATTAAGASDYEHPVRRQYAATPPSPAGQSDEQMAAKSSGCLSCHTASDRPTMHPNPAIKLGCADCHGGDAHVALPAGTARGTATYRKVMDSAHVLPRYPKSWNYPSSANPQRTYTLLNRESPEFIRFMNPSDYRVVEAACGSCHADIIAASARSLHSTAAMFWGGASYNNGILPYKNYILGESYDHTGAATLLRGPVLADNLKDAAHSADILPQLYPLPAWESVKPADIFRVFERGGRNIGSIFPETGIPSSRASSSGSRSRAVPTSVNRIAARERARGLRSRYSTSRRRVSTILTPGSWAPTTSQATTASQAAPPAMWCMPTTVIRGMRAVRTLRERRSSQTVDPTISKAETGHPLTHSSRARSRPASA